MTESENVFDLRKIEEWHTKEILISIYEALKNGEQLKIVNSASLDWLNNEINGANVKSSKLSDNLWTATLVKNEKKECCGMCGHN